MFKNLLKKRAREIRFIGALVLCIAFIAASPTSPSDDSGCGDSASTKGTIIVQNYDFHRVTVTVNGPTSDSFTLNEGYQRNITASTGSYTVVAHDSSGHQGSEVYSRSFTLSESETETCALYW